jgi:cytochrome c
MKKTWLICLYAFTFEKMLISDAEKLVYNQPVNTTSNTSDFLEKNDEVNIERKQKEAETMVSKAIKFLKANNLEKVAREFGQNNQWRKGEIFPFLLDIEGNVIVHGDDTNLIWKNLPKINKNFGNIFKDLKQRSVKGGWIHYKWHNGFKSVYVKQIEKNGVFYIVGAGFFPESQRYDAQRLVEDAVSTFYRDGKEETIALVNNSYGRFVKGGIYVFMYDYNGNVIAHADNPALVNQNLLHLRDSKGNFLIRGLIQVAQSKDGKGWFDYEWKGEPKRAYVARIIDPVTGQPFLMGAGYHPHTTLDDVYEFVSKAIRHLKDVGAKQGFIDFSNPVGRYIKGELAITVYDLEGRVVADGDHPEFVGQTLRSLRDAEGKYIVRAILDTANKEGKGTVTYMEKNAYKTVYVEKIDLPDGKFVITSGFYPASKAQNTRSLVDKGMHHLRTNDVIRTFNAFQNTEGTFFRGDLSLFVYTPDATALVNGLQSNVIWKNFANVRDDSGKNIVAELIDLAKAGGGWATYKSRNATRRVYVHLLEKNNHQNNKETFIIGSGYYL